MNEVIDIHAHAVLEGVFGAAGPYGPELLEGPEPRFRSGDHVLHGVRYRGSPFMDVDARLERMEAVGIDRQVLSPNPLYYFHHVDPAIANGFARQHNDLLAGLVADQPRLDSLALLPLQDPDAAVMELDRSVRELGMLGAYVGTRTTRELDDPAFDDLWGQFIALGVPLFLHPAPDAVDAPTRDPRLSRWDLDLLIGFAYDETIAVATLIYGGVLHRHPDLQVCISHGGGAAPFLYGRMAAAAGKRPWSPEWLREHGEFERQLRSMWFDCHVHDPRAVRLLEEVVGLDRMVYGTNFAGWDEGGGDVLGERTPAIHANTRRLLGR
jgi:aminocarboxymuconate-semialdehyde decarboxylase